MTVNQMRCEIAKAYDGTEWKTKCENMESRQVYAIYARLSQSGKLEQAEYERRKNKNAPKQISMFDKEYTNE